MMRGSPRTGTGVVGRAAETEAEALGGGHDLRQEVHQVPAQSLGRDGGIVGDAAADVGKREVLGGTGMAEGDVGRRREAAVLVGPGEAAGGGFAAFSTTCR